LAAQIFAEFAREYDGDLGYGIYSMDITEEVEENPTVFVNADTGDYKIQGEEWITNKELRENYYGFRTSQPA
jgi:hypothetical protein